MSQSGGWPPADQPPLPGLVAAAAATAGGQAEPPATQPLPFPLPLSHLGLPFGLTGVAAPHQPAPDGAVPVPFALGSFTQLLQQASQMHAHQQLMPSPRQLTTSAGQPTPTMVKEVPAVFAAAPPATYSPFGAAQSPPPAVAPTQPAHTPGAATAAAAAIGQGSAQEVPAVVVAAGSGPNLGSVMCAPRLLSLSHHVSQVCT